MSHNRIYIQSLQLQNMLPSILRTFNIAHQIARPLHMTSASDSATSPADIIAEQRTAPSGSVICAAVFALACQPMALGSSLPCLLQTIAYARQFAAAVKKPTLTANVWTLNRFVNNVVCNRSLALFSNQP
jgi:hypothetical protein